MISHKSSMRRLRIVSAAALTAVPLTVASVSASATSPASASPHVRISCEYSTLCPDVTDSAQVFGEDEYVGHDEPSLVFYSNQPGAGNRTQYSVTLPKEPSASDPTQPGKSYNFELNGALWFGMALCDTQS